jgi:hypothetical protein
MAERKTALTFEERITAAYLHYVRGVEQQDIAVAFSVNMGRVNEVCLAVRDALRPPELSQDKLRNVYPVQRDPRDQ